MRTTILLLAAAACSSSGPDAHLIKPPVKAATPTGLLPTSARFGDFVGALPLADFKAEFFSGAGPTDAFTILQSADNRVGEFNASTNACTNQAAVDYSIHPLGQTVAMKAQCAKTLAPSGFFQVATDVAGNSWAYVAIGATALAAVVTPGATPDDDSAEVWYGVGYDNAATCATFDNCSYAIVHILAKPATHAFEMAVAGIGVGYCGIQIKSDGTSIYAKGSRDMGATCNAIDDLCVGADLTSAGSCASLMTFDLPAIGRMGSTGSHSNGASMYPATANVALDGTSSDALHFGPATPTAGAGTMN